MSPDPELPPPPALPVAETVILDQAGAAATEPVGGHGPVHPHCENCGTRLTGPFCHQCGQHDFDIHRSFRHVFVEAADALFNIEGRFFQSLITLLFHPGRLTADFIAGKRVVQMPPLRLYLFVSFLFFLVIFLGGTGDEFVRETNQPHQGITVNDQPVVFRGAKPEAAPPAASGDSAEPAGTAPPATTRLVDRLRATADEARARAEEKSGHKEKPAFARKLEAQARRMSDPAYRQRLSERIQASVPHLLMLGLPCFALYTRFLFRKSGLMYLQHLVLALHFHTFIYLWILCSKGWAGLADLPGWGLGFGVALGCNLWLCLYPLLMLRRLFANSWPWTVGKALLLTVGYWLTLILGFMVLAVSALLLE